MRKISIKNRKDEQISPQKQEMGTKYRKVPVFYRRVGRSEKGKQTKKHTQTHKYTQIFTDPHTYIQAHTHLRTNAQVIKIIYTDTH
jgi:hypothetical protein